MQFHFTVLLTLYCWAGSTVMGVLLGYIDVLRAHAWSYFRLGLLFDSSLLFRLPQSSCLQNDEACLLVMHPPSMKQQQTKFRKNRFGFFRHRE